MYASRTALQAHLALRSVVRCKYGPEVDDNRPLLSSGYELYIDPQTGAVCVVWTRFMEDDETTEDGYQAEYEQLVDCLDVLHRGGIACDLKLHDEGRYFIHCYYHSTVLELNVRQQTAAPPSNVTSIFDRITRKLGNR